MKCVAIVQARMTSTRLPGKVMADVGGRPLLEVLIRRLKRCKEICDIVVATTTRPTDAAVVATAERQGVRWFRGSELDVLGRFVAAGREADAEVIVRATGDCPLFDPEVAD